VAFTHPQSLKPNGVPRQSQTILLNRQRLAEISYLRDIVRPDRTYSPVMTNKMIAANPPLQ